MAAIAVGHKVIYHSDHGPCVAFVTEYEAGRDGGDYTLKVLTSPAWKDAGGGDITQVQSVVGDERGAFTP